MQRVAQRKAQKNTEMEDARRQIKKDGEGSWLKKKKRAKFQGEAAETEKSAADLQREAFQVENEKGGFTSEAAEAAEDGGDDVSIIPNRGDLNEKVHNTP